MRYIPWLCDIGSNFRFLTTLLLYLLYSSIIERSSFFLPEERAAAELIISSKAASVILCLSCTENMTNVLKFNLRLIWEITCFCEAVDHISDPHHIRCKLCIVGSKHIKIESLTGGFAVTSLFGHFFNTSLTSRAAVQVVGILLKYFFTTSQLLLDICL